MIIVAIDLAINGVGLAKRDMDTDSWSLRLLSRKKIKKDFVIRLEKKDGLEKFIEIRDRIIEFCGNEMDLGKCDIVVLEDFSFGSQGRAVFDLGQLHGIVRLGLRDMGYRFVTVSPSEVKKAATGRGNASKIEVSTAICKKHGIDYGERFGEGVKDICDAIAIVYAYMKKYSVGMG